MLRQVIVAASMVLATAAFAQGSTQKSGPGQSEFAPGHQPNTNKGPGHSESAPGQQPNKAGPGHSESVASARTASPRYRSGGGGRRPISRSEYT